MNSTISRDPDKIHQNCHYLDHVSGIIKFKTSFPLYTFCATHPKRILCRTQFICIYLSLLKVLLIHFFQRITEDNFYIEELCKGQNDTSQSNFFLLSSFDEWFSIGWVKLREQDSPWSFTFYIEIFQIEIYSIAQNKWTIKNNRKGLILIIANVCFMITMISKCFINWIHHELKKHFFWDAHINPFIPSIILFFYQQDYIMNKPVL